MTRMYITGTVKASFGITVDAADYDDAHTILNEQLEVAHLLDIDVETVEIDLMEPDDG